MSTCQLSPSAALALPFIDHAALLADNWNTIRADGQGTGEL